MIILIVAFDEDYNIGKDNSIPWHFSEDLIHFKKLTTNNVCVMGKNTWISLPKKPLPNRENIIVSKTYYQNNFSCENTFVVKSLKDAIYYYINKFKEKHLFLIGGYKIFEESISKKIIDKMIITKVKGSYEGDVKFPKINWEDWKEKEVHTNKDFCIFQYDKLK
jgi:dihydrofolate reductase